ncbi:MAG TPA: 50S ribosomal protein L32e [Candidatus Methanoculleus thermohydrogenotrophicum]|jgi:large subunit ribosomal protein L32e|nr:50S ribosomal protein L32e [Candidatus Methanoculleus thermohydrogenotrophicum]NLM81697.1 50S ribosomal protein L32e [Candidatus Methanoculleus thermohydrogenotrophicum]HOB17837.1 50S ribosomal protein L32e [Candidatus Methanoculleus thermohydrogenotrophicum]HPZ37392.1 50S ribosomal protein L32e [Candidatus Methanoculleus thermohydrogenotrophicum]HQC91264.1 50S ribosomal protein L32e [Candidatus Methanoculleus thermohydrogenotrophicum]
MDERKRLIRVRTRHNKPAFKRRGLHRKVRLADVWRRPRGLQSKQRRQFRAKGALPRPGYGSPAAVRGLHPSGYEEVRVFSPADLAGLNPDLQAVRIAGSVGNRKRRVIQAQAMELGLKVLNAKDLTAVAPVPVEDEEEEVDEDE